MELAFAQSKGFTLAELLIALVILGVIATFTIPKVLQSQQDTRYNAIAKETLGAVSQAYQTYRLSNTVTAGTATTDILQYLNYVTLDTSSQIDAQYTHATLDCSNGTQKCYVLHNGAMLSVYKPIRTFGTTDSTAAMAFFLDPDGKVTDGTTNGPGKGLMFFLYIDGAIRDRGNTKVPTCDSTSCGWPATNPGETPPWFSWS